MKKLFLLLVLAIVMTLPSCRQGGDIDTTPTQATQPTHIHSYTGIVTSPTCTADGFTTHTCACGHSYTDSVTPATGHDWADWVITKEPTAVSRGLARRVCRACGTSEEKILDKSAELHGNG